MPSQHNTFFGGPCLPGCAGPVKDLGHVVAAQEKKKVASTTYKPVDYSCRAVSCQWVMSVGRVNGV